MIKYQKEFNKFKKELKKYKSHLLYIGYTDPIIYQIIVREFEKFMNKIIKKEMTYVKYL